MTDATNRLRTWLDRTKGTRAGIGTLEDRFEDEGITLQRDDIYGAIQENEILREQLRSVRLLAEALKKAAELGSGTEPESDLWLSVSHMATELCCAL